MPAASVLPAFLRRSRIPGRRAPSGSAPPPAFLAPVLAAILAPVLAAVAAPGPAMAQAAPAPQAAATAPAVTIELNRLEALPQGCRAWLLMRNPDAEAVDPLRLDLLMFGRDGVIARRVALDVGPLPANKTLARIFDLAGLECGAIGSVLLNDLLACGPAPEGRAACLPRIATSSRVPGVGFDK